MLNTFFREWKSRGVQEEKDFAILTNEISKATFGKTVGEYKQFKGLKKPNQNLRDHMNDWELILTMFGEKATTDITIAKDAKGFPQLKHSAKEGGDIAKNARKELEQKIGKSVVSNENYLYLSQKKKRKLLKEKKIAIIRGIGYEKRGTISFSCDSLGTGSSRQRRARVARPVLQRH